MICLLSYKDLQASLSTRTVLKKMKFRDLLYFVIYYFCNKKKTNLQNKHNKNNCYCHCYHCVYIISYIVHHRLHLHEGVALRRFYGGALNYKGLSRSQGFPMHSIIIE